MSPWYEGFHARAFARVRLEFRAADRGDRASIFGSRWFVKYSDRGELYRRVELYGADGEVL